MDRYWNEDGQPFLFQNEKILITAPGVTPKVLSGLNIKIKDLKQGILYISNLRLIFISQIKGKAKDPRMKFDGFSIFYSDIHSASIVGKGSLKIECVLEKGKIKSKKANVFFKDLPKDIKNEVIIRIEESLQDRGLPSTFEEPVYTEPEEPTETQKVVQSPPPMYSSSVDYLLDEVGDSDLHLTCPLCGSLVRYYRGMTTCPACKRNVKFIAD